MKAYQLPGVDVAGKALKLLMENDPEIHYVIYPVDEVMWNTEDPSAPKIHAIRSWTTTSIRYPGMASSAIDEKDHEYTLELEPEQEVEVIERPVPEEDEVHEDEDNVAGEDVWTYTDYGDDTLTVSATDFPDPNRVMIETSENALVSFPREDLGLLISNILIAAGYTPSRYKLDETGDWFLTQVSIRGQHYHPAEVYANADVDCLLAEISALAFAHSAFVKGLEEMTS